MFAESGEVKAATVGRDKKTEASQRYGFVDMPVKSEAQAASEASRGEAGRGAATGASIEARGMILIRRQ